MLSSVQSCTEEVVLPHPEWLVIFRKHAADIFSHSKWCWEVCLDVHCAAQPVLIAVLSVFLQIFVFKAPQDEEFASKGPCFFMRLKKKSLPLVQSLSVYLFIYIYFAPEAFISWIGFSRSNFFSAYLIRSWNRVMKFTGLCSLDLKYRWAKHSFCSTPCQIRVLFLSLLFISFQWIATAQSNCKTHTVVFFFCITETCKWLLRDIIM